MLKVGLTGGIATGKTTVGGMFAELGCRLIDADQISRELFEPGQPVHAAVVAEFGQRILTPAGAIDRRTLGDIVFKNPELRQKLNDLVHPAVIERQQRWLKEVETVAPDGIAIVEAALMIEVGTYRNYDKLIVVGCSREIQKERLRQRTDLSEKQIESRVASQMPFEEKVKYADYVIDTSGDLEETRREVERINSKLRELVGSTLNKRQP